MRMVILLCAVLTVFSGGALARQKSSPSAASSHWQTGVVIPKVICVRHAGQSYTLYLPSDYSRKKLWPIVYAFDPLARGSLPVALMKEAA